MTYKEFLRVEFDKYGIDHEKGLDKLISLIKKDHPDELELISKLTAIKQDGGLLGWIPQYKLSCRMN